MSDDKIIEKFEMQEGSEEKEYLHLRFNNAPFGTFPADIEDIKKALKKQREALPSVKEISKIIMESRIKDLYVPEAHDYENDRIAKKLHERIQE